MSINVSHERTYKVMAKDTHDDSFLDRPAVVYWGASADATYWTPGPNKQQVPGTLREALAHITKMQESDEKDGKSFLQGRLKPSKFRRQAADMGVMEFAGFDIESGEEPEPIAEKARGLGIHIEIHPSYSDGKPESKIATSAVMRHCKLGQEQEATGEQVLETMQATKGWLPHVVASAKFEGRKGHNYIVSHCPLPRFHVIIPFSKRLDLEELSMSPQGAATRWKMILEEIGGLLGIKDYDEKCTDLNRLFYPHRRPKGAEDRLIRVLGRGIDPYELKAATVSLADAPTKAAKNAGGDFKAKHAWRTPWLKAELDKYATKFRAADFVVFHEAAHETYADGVHTECPHPHASGANSIKDLFIINAEDATNKGGTFIFKCSHGTCKDVSSWQMLDTFIADREITRENFLEFVDRTEEIEQEAKIAADLAEITKEIAEAVAKITKASTAADVEAVLRLMAQREKGLQEEIDLEALKKSGPVGLQMLRGLLNKYRRERLLAAAAAAEAAPAPPAEESGVVIRETFKAKRRKIEAGNAAEPTWFMRDDGTHMRLNKNASKTRVEEFDSAAWQYELFTHAGPGDCPDGTWYSGAIQLMKGATDWQLPIFDAIAYVPIFSPDGSLRTTPGYDEATKTYLAPGFDFIPLPVVVTEEHVNKALDLIDEVGIDLPFSDSFGSVDTLQQYGEVYDKDGWALPNPERGKSSRAHWMAMIIQPFVRLMINGPVPIYNVDACTNGEGKTLCTWAPSIIYEGEPFAPTPLADDQDERRKALLAKLRRGPSYILFDNKNAGTVIDFPDLAAAVTASRYEGRELGHSWDINVKVSGSFIFTGVGTQFSAELKRRCVPIRIDSGMEDPTVGREFKHNFEGYLKENRRALVHAVHILVTWWVQNGRRRSPGGCLASFEAWEGVLGGILQAAGSLASCSPWDPTEIRPRGGPSGKMKKKSSKRWSTPSA